MGTKDWAMARDPLRIYETQDTNPDTNSAIGDWNLSPDDLVKFLRGKTVTRYRTRSLGLETTLIFYLSDGSTMMINGNNVGLDILKKK